eukprot:scaffold45238_cov19-Tisochrysis_lutea.AAC.4
MWISLPAAEPENVLVCSKTGVPLFIALDSSSLLEKKLCKSVWIQDLRPFSAIASAKARALKALVRGCTPRVEAATHISPDTALVAEALFTVRVRAWPS